MNKRSTKVICFAISIDYFVCPVQVLIERFYRKLMKYGFNHCFSIVNDDFFAPSLSASWMAAWKKTHYVRMFYIQELQ